MTSSGQPLNKQLLSNGLLEVQLVQVSDLIINSFFYIIIFHIKRLIKL